ncbi:MAG: peroxiredoxin [Gammaproteobacteria bacterium]|nr:peroxiredoxin [Gammaproteobacteria bacterium]MDP6146922.1 peroxiredoxin [Gammaproteobacteria bacterium]HJL79773.1 peroxiredoxin [Gammaproteobacteria bacterium]|tara:strand:+ start:11374 stop:11841 length:468 start_codon:yes stop_codon:yes gene_type:complete
MSKVKIGKKIPPFTSKLDDDSNLISSDLIGKNIVIYFYPKDSTPGCTKEGEDFRDLHKAFTKSNSMIFGVSRDSIASHEKFKTKHNFPFHLISDENESLCKIFDVIKEKNMYGRKYMGIERSTFLIDESGVLIKEWRKVKVKGHAQEVLDILNNL